jgi:23S rRNA (pseudouridine1915-N3)-methyltransferase
MQVQVIAVGRVRDAALRSACDEYAARISRYLKFDIREVRDAGRRDRDAESGRRAEADTLRATSPTGAFRVALSRSGRQVDSEELARMLRGWQRDARDVALMIGGAHGIAADLVAEADLTLSLSTMTFPHELARLVLLEQLYRACTILRGEPYHKGGAA